MNTIYLVYSTDAWHSYSSQDLIAACDSKDQAINMIGMYAKAKGEAIDSDDLYNLSNLNQTQGREGDEEYIIEEVQLNTFINQIPTT